MAVLVTDANLGYAWTVIQSLGKKGIEITVAGEKGSSNMLFYSKNCRERLIYPKPENEDAFISAMRGAKHK